jgi:hypothetical protein
LHSRSAVNQNGNCVFLLVVDRTWAGGIRQKSPVVLGIVRGSTAQRDSLLAIRARTLAFLPHSANDNA